MNQAMFDKEEVDNEIKGVWGVDNLNQPRGAGGLYLRLSKGLSRGLLSKEEAQYKNLIILDVVNSKGAPFGGGYLLQFDIVTGKFARYFCVSKDLHIQLDKERRIAFKGKVI